jgi:hypothetical protein
MQRAEGTVVIEAISLDDPTQRHVSRSLDGEGEDETQRAAYTLAKMISVELNEASGPPAGEAPAP